MMDSSTAGAGWLRTLGLHRKELRSWALYDWGNSAFATTIMAAVLPIYYASIAGPELCPGIEAGESCTRATSYWGYTTSIALFIIAIAAPMLGAMADYMGAKKRFLGAFMGMGVVGTAALYFAGSGDWMMASGLFIIANIGFAGSIVFADSLLPHIADDDEVDRVSTAGYALGYVGGGLLLAVNLAMIIGWETFGFADRGSATRWSFVSVAVWWALFSIPLFRNVPEPRRRLEDDEGPRLNPVRVGFERLSETVGEIRQYKELFKFLVAFFLYSDGIGTIIKMATIYGAEIGLPDTAMIGALLLVQFIGIPFTFAFGALAARIGAKNGLYITLAVYTGITVLGYFVSEAWHFWMLAIAVGMVQGGAQALSRSLYSTMVPRGKSSEFFAFFSVFAKFAGIMGPLVFGIVGQITGTSRLGILALIVFFVGGIWMLTTVDVDEGRRAARREDSTLKPAPPVTPAIP